MEGVHPPIGVVHPLFEGVGHFLSAVGSGEL